MINRKALQKFLANVKGQKTWQGFDGSKNQHLLAFSSNGGRQRALSSRQPIFHFSGSTRFQSTASATYDQSVDSFPSIGIGPDRAIIPQGSFAEAQAQVSWFRNMSSVTLCRISIRRSRLHSYVFSHLMALIYLLVP